MLPFTQPEITESINKLTFEWHDLELLVIADRITDSGSAELWFHHNNGTGRKLLHTTKVNLLSTATMNQVAKRLAQENSPDHPWHQILTKIAAVTMETRRKGEPGVTLQPIPGQVTHPGYWVEPIIMKGVPNIIFGDKGSNKTTLALMAMALLYAGADSTDYSNCGFNAPERANVALLDWESTQELTLYTSSRLIEGGTVPYFELPYLRCRQTLADEIERVSNFVRDNKIQVVLIDSLGQAAGSDKYDTAGKTSALNFFECLRQLNLTSLIIAQNAKGSEEGNKKTIYGSTYFTYYARNIFELRKAREQNRDNEMSVALFHHESNYSKKYEPRGFNISYSDQAIRITSEAVNARQFMEKVSQSAEILDLLAGGAMTLKAIGSALDTSENQTRVVLHRLRDRGKILQLGQGLWGLKAEEVE